MSLSTGDLKSIRTIMREELRAEVSIQLGPVNGRLRDIDERLTGVEGRLEAVENDVKDIFFMLEPRRPGS